MNHKTMEDQTFFIAGGTLPLDSKAYVKRPADDELYYLLRASKFCYVLTPRQMGKSSLMVRTAQRLQADNVRTAVIDLTRIGTTLSADQWYLGLLRGLVTQLNLPVNVGAWWHDHAGLSPVQRLADFLRDVLLAHISGNVVIFVDEIDSTLSLDFSDDFFAAIRYVFNGRASEPVYERLTFALLGVATPADLIKDSTRTPFNIGERIDLEEFSKMDAQPLQSGLIQAHPGRGASIFDRIYYWTNGHPYLTQKLCLVISDEPHKDWTDGRIDDLVSDLFLSDKARRETNLQFMRDYINRSPIQRELVQLYDKVYRGKQVVDDERSLVQNQLKLIGLVKANQNTAVSGLSAERILIIRNQIYAHAFNKAWIKATLPTDWTRRIAMTGVVLIILLIAAIGYFIFQQRQLTTTAAEQTLTDLNRLFESGEIDNGFARYNRLTEAEKLALFSAETDALEEEAGVVVQAIYSTLGDTETNNALLTAMQLALTNDGSSTNQNLAREIEHILNGRQALAEGNYQEAEDSFNEALFWNEQNPISKHGRGLALTELGNCQAAMSDFESVINLTQTSDDALIWQTQLRNRVRSTPCLHATLAEPDQGWAQLIALVPAPTRTSTHTPTVTPSATPTLTPSHTTTPVETATPSHTPTIPATGTPSATPTLPPSATPTATPTSANQSGGATTGAGLPYDFSQFGSWSIGDQNYGTFTQSTQQSRGGAAGKIEYDFLESEGSADDFVVFSQFNAIDGTPNALQIWVFGDASGNFLNAWIIDDEGQTWQVPFGRINHTGWKQLTGYIVEGQDWPWTHISGSNNGRVDFPIRFRSFVLDSPAPSGSGVIYLDDLTAVTVADAPEPIFPTATPTN